MTILELYEIANFFYSKLHINSIDYYISHDSSEYYIIIDSNLSIQYYPNILLRDKELHQLRELNIGRINGYFEIRGLDIKSLKNCPRRIKKSFYCDKNSLENLKYTPEFVGGIYNCSHNKLTIIDENIICNHFNASNNKIRFISNKLIYNHINLYKNPYFYFKKYHYEL